MVLSTWEMKIKNLDAMATPLDGLRLNFVYEDVRAMPLRNSNNEIISSFVFWDLGFVFWVPELVEGWVPELVEGCVPELVKGRVYGVTIQQFSNSTIGNWIVKRGICVLTSKVSHYYRCVMGLRVAMREG